LIAGKDLDPHIRYALIRCTDITQDYLQYLKSTSLMIAATIMGIEIFRVMEAIAQALKGFLDVI
jgi:hypothetical protein